MIKTATTVSSYYITKVAWKADIPGEINVFGVFIENDDETHINKRRYVC
jgi:hypothetical protein